MRQPLSMMAVTALALLLAAPAHAQVTGDAQPLLLAAARHEENLGRLITWQGKAAIKILETLGEQKDTYGMNCTAAFFYDAGQRSSRWTFAVQEAWKGTGDAAVPAPEQADTRDQMATPDGFYELAPGVTRPGSGVWERSLVIMPLGKAGEKVANSSRSFDPMGYVQVDGMPMADFVAACLDESKNREGPMPLQTTVTQESDLVTVEKRYKELVKRWTFDLARGGQLIHTSDSTETGEETTTEDYTYSLQKGVWVMSTYRHRHSGQWPSSKEVQITESTVNAQIPASQFTIEAMGVVPGTRISDNRRGLFWIYGREQETLAVTGVGRVFPRTLPSSPAGDETQGASPDPQPARPAGATREANTVPPTKPPAMASAAAAEDSAVVDDCSPWLVPAIVLGLALVVGAGFGLRRRLRPAAQQKNDELV